MGQGPKYRAKAYAALSLPNPEEAPPDGSGDAFVLVGDIDLRACPQALDAVVARYVGRVRKVIAHARDLPAEAEEAARLDLLTFPEYLEAVAGIARLRDRYDLTAHNRKIALLEARREALEEQRDIMEDIERQQWAKHDALMQYRREEAEARRKLTDLRAELADEDYRYRERDREQRALEQHDREGERQRREREREAERHEREQQQQRDKLARLMEELERRQFALEKVENEMCGHYALSGRERDEYEHEIDYLSSSVHATYGKLHALKNEGTTRLIEYDGPRTPRAEILPPSRSGYIRQAAALMMDGPPDIYIDTFQREAHKLDSLKKLADMELAHLREDTVTPLNEYKTKAFAAEFLPHHFTANRAGYLAYLETFNPALRQFFLRRLPALLKEEDRKRHTYITGQTGSGKSTLLKVLMYSYVQRNDCAVLLIDPKGDLAEDVARFPGIAERLVYIKPTLSDTHAPCLNPFECKDTSEMAVHVAAELLAGVFEQLVSRAGYAEATGNMKTLLMACISTLLQRPGSTILDLLAFMDEERNEFLVKAGMHSTNQTHREFFAHQFHAKAFDQAKTAISNRLWNLLQSPVIRRLFVGQSTFNVEDAINQKKIIVFSLPPGKAGEDSGPMLGCFVVAMLQGIAIRRCDDRTIVPCHAFIDECQYYLTDSIKDIITFSGRSYGLHLTLAQQQFCQEMSAKLAGAIIGNTAIKIAGRNDVDTLKKMNERMHAPFEDMISLDTGDFFVKVSGNSPAFKIHAPYLGKKYRITGEEWHALQAVQLGRWYRALSADKPEPSDLAREIAAGKETSEPAPDGKKRKPGRPGKPAVPQYDDFV